MTGDPIERKTIVLGVTGSIACYKAADLASKLTQAGASVEVILTAGARQFLTPLTFRSLTHRPVVADLFDPDSELAVQHVALAERAHLVVVAPATANVIAKLAVGLADDALTATILATRAPVMVAPAMDAHMYENPAVQENLQRLRQRGMIIVGPAKGRLASGLYGLGRLVEVELLLGHIRLLLGRNGDLAGRTVVVSAGGTQEPVDPVRVVTNRSSGKMGYALAEAARDRGARAILVTAPTALPDPVGVEAVHVETAVQMREAILRAIAGADVLIMAAAVADYMPVSMAPQKVKKGPETWTLQLTRTPDILKEADGNIIKVGFAAESENLLANARDKLLSKGLHLIVANDITAPESGFGVDTNKVALLERDGGVEELPLMGKYQVAHRILDRVARLLAGRPRAI
ncbi:MAG: bifunctional phosphopantothenoylcysteine decarboxylase/phosphopantothenate--cysteine ligase CoaBC [Chloroflexi bacterium]|nr:bifunctional phosphopantothenoylcysteine decarboxylase/phosphopantothenate--cysteine ligase CoaBC [Chloroflexota bacterium]